MKLAYVPLLEKLLVLPNVQNGFIKNQKRNMDGPIILQGIGGKSIKILILVDIHMDINT